MGNTHNLPKSTIQYCDESEGFYLEFYIDLVMNYKNDKGPIVDNTYTAVIGPYKLYVGESLDTLSDTILINVNDECKKYTNYRVLKDTCRIDQLMRLTWDSKILYIIMNEYFPKVMFCWTNNNKSTVSQDPLRIAVNI
jgi:hypothetical protein